MVYEIDLKNDMVLLFMAGAAAHWHRWDWHAVCGEMPVVWQMDISPRERRGRLPVPAAEVDVDVGPVALADQQWRDPKGGRR